MPRVTFPPRFPSLLKNTLNSKESSMIIVVTGATGNVGRPLVAELVAAGARVRAVSRSPQSTEFPHGVEAVGSVVDALPDASAVFLNSRALGAGLADAVTHCR